VVHSVFFWTRRSVVYHFINRKIEYKTHMHPLPPAFRLHVCLFTLNYSIKSGDFQSPTPRPWPVRAVRAFAPAIIHMYVSSPAVTRVVARFGEVPLNTQSLQCLHNVQAHRVMIEFNPFCAALLTEAEICLYQSSKCVSIGWGESAARLIRCSMTCQNCLVNTQLVRRWWMVSSSWSQNGQSSGCGRFLRAKVVHTVIDITINTIMKRIMPPY
jgi:hypothetical protein